MKTTATLRRSAMKPGKKPMVRKQWATKPAARQHKAKPAKARTDLKSTRPKTTAIRASARGKECTLRFPMVCNFDTSTTVLCHSNRLADGKGMGLKAPDTKAAYGCSACHDVMDGRAPRPAGLTQELVEQLTEEGIAQTQRIVRRAGLLTKGQGDER